LPRNRRHYRITFADAVSAHEYALQQSPGRPGIHDRGRIDAAINRPYSGYHRPIYKKAGALIEAVSNNHGFVDGNKRTALVLFDLLLARSGYEFVATSTVEDEDDVERLILDVTTHFMTFDECIGWLKSRIRPAR